MVYQCPMGYIIIVLKVVMDGEHGVNYNRKEGVCPPLYINRLISLFYAGILIIKTLYSVESVDSTFILL